MHILQTKRDCTHKELKEGDFVNVAYWREHTTIGKIVKICPVMIKVHFGHVDIYSYYKPKEVLKVTAEEAFKYRLTA